MCLNDLLALGGGGNFALCLEEYLFVFNNGGMVVGWYNGSDNDTGGSRGRKVEVCVDGLTSAPIHFK